jgi:hypothetical protein
MKSLNTRFLAWRRLDSIRANVVFSRWRDREGGRWVFDAGDRNLGKHECALNIGVTACGATS